MKQITCYDVAKQPTLVGQKWGSAPYLPENLKQAIAFIRKLVVVSHTAEQVKTRKPVTYVESHNPARSRVPLQEDRK